jgi:hypothetical protein
LLAHLAALERIVDANAAALPAAVCASMRGRIALMRQRVTRPPNQLVASGRWELAMWWMGFVWNALSLRFRHTLEDYYRLMGFIWWADKSWVAVKMAYMEPLAPELSGQP